MPVAAGGAAAAALFGDDDSSPCSDGTPSSATPGNAAGSRHVSFKKGRAFLHMCRVRPERMRLLCSTKCGRDGGDQLVVSVEVAEGGPTVEVREISMADGWTGCRFSPSALWLAFVLAQRGPLQFTSGSLRPRALELGCGVALAGLTAHAIGFDTTLTDCLPGHLRNLRERVGTCCSVCATDVGADGDTISVHAVAETSVAHVRVRRLDWIEEVGVDISANLVVDRGSPENKSGATAVEFARLCAHEAHSFDLILASDVLYEEHHAVLLPLVLERYLRAGGKWMLSFAIRDAPMLVRFLTALGDTGVLAIRSNSSGECLVDLQGLSWETSCVPEKCEFCAGIGATSPGRESVPFIFLSELLHGHEGGAVLFEGRRPV